MINFFMQHKVFPLLIFACKFPIQHDKAGVSLESTSQRVIGAIAEISNMSTEQAG